MELHVIDDELLSESKENGKLWRIIPDEVSMKEVNIR